MRVLILAVLLAVLGRGEVRAEVPPVSMTAAKSKAWTGERVQIQIELRAMGSFAGSAVFHLPEIPGALMIKVGNPVVGSKQIEGEKWFTQSHSFALFSQKSGAVEIPPFPVHFGWREEFTGPAQPIEAQTESLALQIQRPPQSEGIGFLVTTEELDISETWDPVLGEGEAAIGDILRRTIVQKAEGLTGMALSPASSDAPEGVRVYEPEVETSDDTERGAFRGERRETLTYLLQKDGSITLPELTYTWWNPKSESLQSKTLPAVTVQVAAAASVSEASESSQAKWHWQLWLGAILPVAFMLWQRHRIAAVIRAGWRRIDTPERAAARHLCRACRHNDAAAAQKCWNRWVILTGRELRAGSDLQSAVLEMQRSGFGPAGPQPWNGTKMLDAFRNQAAKLSAAQSGNPSRGLPGLNSPDSFLR